MFLRDGALEQPEAALESSSALLRSAGHFPVGMLGIWGE